MPIQPSEFIESFNNEWGNAIKDHLQKIIEAYPDSKKWTKYMLGRDDGFLSRVMKGIDANESALAYKAEWYTLDALYIAGENTYEHDMAYPSQLQALIEHENGDNVEEEMWKLMFWRSPLKVIIFYDYPEYEKRRGDENGRKRKWLDNKLNDLWGMLKKANAFFPENDATNYLLIVGNRENEEDKIPQWKCWVMNHEKFQSIHPSS